jgi:plasmid maintenance system antidote protein VapI
MNNDFIIEVPQNMEDQSYIDFILEDYPITDAEKTVLSTRRSVEQIIQQGDCILAHPGVFIYDHILHPRKILLGDLCGATGISLPSLLPILYGLKNISLTPARRFEQVLGIDATSLLEMQDDYSEYIEYCLMESYDIEGEMALKKAAPGYISEYHIPTKEEAQQEVVDKLRNANIPDDILRKNKARYGVTTHPGVFLQEHILKPSGISLITLAAATELCYTDLWEFQHARIAFDGEQAEKLVNGLWIGAGPDVVCDLLCKQAQYDAQYHSMLYSASAIHNIIKVKYHYEQENCNQ